MPKKREWHRPTALKIAEEAGIPISAVRVWLRNEASVDIPTQQAIRKAVEKIGMPSQKATNMPLTTVGLLVDPKDPFDDFTITLIHYLQSYGVDIRLGYADENTGSQEMELYKLLDRGVREIISARVRWHPQAWERIIPQLRHHSASTVFLNYDLRILEPYLKETDVPLVGSVRYETASELRKIADHLFTLGCRRFTYINGGDFPMEDEGKTIQEFANKNGVDFNVIYPTTFDVEGAYDGVQRYLDRLSPFDDPPIVIFGIYELAQGALSAVRRFERNKLSDKLPSLIPTKISIFGLYDNERFRESPLFENMTRLDIREEEVAMSAVYLLKEISTARKQGKTYKFSGDPERFQRRVTIFPVYGNTTP